MRSDSTILLSGWSASRVSRRAKAGTNKNARHSPALTAHPPLRSWTSARASTSVLLLFLFSDLPSLPPLPPRPSPVPPAVPLSEPYPLSPSPPLPLLLLLLLLLPVRVASATATAAATFLVLSRSPSKTNQIFDEVLTLTLPRKRRWPRLAF